jgi:putative intracellular protease/amidase
MTTALFVVSEEGYWGEECIEPLATLDEAGVDVTVATPTGNPPVVDERSVDPETVGEEISEKVLDYDENDERLANPEPIATVEAGDYDTVVFPGGHGTAWDINVDRHARQLLADAVAGDDGVALVVCHAVGLLGFTHNDSGEYLVDGRDVTGFPNEWEDDIIDDNDLMGDGRKLPYLTEDEVIKAGGQWDAELDSETSVTVDGDLVTARGPESSAEAARTLLEELGIETPA